MLYSFIYLANIVFDDGAWPYNFAPDTETRVDLTSPEVEMPNYTYSRIEALVTSGEPVKEWQLLTMLVSSFGLYHIFFLNNIETIELFYYLHHICYQLCSLFSNFRQI